MMHQVLIFFTCLIYLYVSSNDCQGDITTTEKLLSVAPCDTLNGSILFETNLRGDQSYLFAGIRRIEGNLLSRNEFNPRIENFLPFSNLTFIGGNFDVFIFSFVF